MKKDLYFEQMHPFVRYVRFLKLSRDVGFPPFIPYDCRLFYTYEGHGQILINNRTYEMPKHTLIIFPSATLYSLLNKSDVLYLAFNFDFTYEHFKQNQPIPPDTPEKYRKSALLEQINFIDQPSFNELVYLNKMEEVEGQLLAIESEFKQKRLYYNNKITALFSDVLTRAVKVVYK